jgi:hypothetical protein
MKNADIKKIIGAGKPIKFQRVGRWHSRNWWDVLGITADICMERKYDNMIVEIIRYVRCEQIRDQDNTAQYYSEFIANQLTPKDLAYYGWDKYADARKAVVTEVNWIRSVSTDFSGNKETWVEDYLETI